MAKTRTSSAAPKGPVSRSKKAAKAKAPEWPGAFGMMRALIEQLQRNPQPAVFYVGVTVLASALSQLIQHNYAYSTNHVSYESLLGLVFLVAIPMYGFALADRKPMTISEFMEIDPRTYFVVLVSGILAVALIIVSALALLVPAFWTIAWFTLVAQPAIDKRCGVIDALKESKRLTRNHKEKVYRVLGVIFLMSLPAYVFSIVPYVGVAPLSLVGLLASGLYASLYRYLQKVDASS